MNAAKTEAAGASSLNKSTRFDSVSHDEQIDAGRVTSWSAQACHQA
jgi:hypothetical protein